MNLGTTTGRIEAAEKTLGVRLPGALREVWLVSNGLELFGEWRLFPVFDPAEPSKTANDIVYENTKGRWESMPRDLLAVAKDDYGNALVLKVDGAQAGAELLFWDHETNMTEPWDKTLDDIQAAARERAAEIKKMINDKSRGKVGLSAETRRGK